MFIMSFEHMDFQQRINIIKLCFKFQENLKKAHERLKSVYVNNVVIRKALYKLHGWFKRRVSWLKMSNVQDVFWSHKDENKHHVLQRHTVTFAKCYIENETRKMG
jgi:hypothetical protein